MSSLKLESQIDLDFLKGLDKKLHEVNSVWHIDHYPYTLWRNIDSYTSQSMTLNELSTLKKILEKKIFLFYPHSSCMGFCVAYSIFDETKNKVLLKFKDEQVPLKDSFGEFSKYFMDQENQRRFHNHTNEFIHNDYRHYEY